MQISYNWLKDYCQHDFAAHELADHLSHAGMCVETYEPREGDWMLDVEVTSNRPDCLSHLGLAREVAAMTGTQVAPPPLTIEKKTAGDFDELAGVQVHCPELCPHYTARVIKNVEVAPSPEWMQKRLQVCGLRPVNNIVDITNFVLLESGQPMHAFDLKRLSSPQIIVRKAEKGEKITTIDGKECPLTENMCVIADAAGPIALAGIMGGVESEINEKTTDVLLESARFHPANIRRTSRSLGLSSDSSYRFERGVDPENVEPASRRAAELFVELAGGTLVPGLADIRTDSTVKPRVRLRTDRLRKVLGIDVEPQKVESIFDGLGIDTLEGDNSSFNVAVPSWRPDLRREIDLIEEVVRIHGYDKIPETTRLPIAIAPQSKREICERKVKKMLAGHGFTEIITSSLVASGGLQSIQPWLDAAPIHLRNPVSSDKTHLRVTNMGNLLQAKKYNNAHKIESVDLFESGKIYLPQDSDFNEQPCEKSCLSVLSDRDNGFFVLKGILQNLLSTLYIKCEEVLENRRQLRSFAEGKSLYFYFNQQLLGCLGELDADMAENLDFTNIPAIMELDFDLLINCAAIEPDLSPLPRFPAIQRDIAVVIDEETQWKDVEVCVRDNAAKELESIEFIDIYRGKQVPEGKKSITFSLSFRSEERTLRSEEGDQFRDAVVDSLSHELGACLRR